jgi:hypothetical protein
MEGARAEGGRMAVPAEPAGRTAAQMPMPGATAGRGVEVGTSLTTSFRVVVLHGGGGVAVVSDGCRGERTRTVGGRVGRKTSWAGDERGTKELGF